MYVDICNYVKKGNKRTRILLRESYRENGKVKKRTIACLNSCSDEEVEAIKLALKNKKDLSALSSLTNIENINITQGKSYGALVVIKSIADRLGITAVLGKGEVGLTAFWQIYSRLIAQGSRRTAIRLTKTHATEFIPRFPLINEKSLYKNLDWLSENQEDIETALMKHRASISTLFLYDVTSSYLEGEFNELAAWGYNRDKKSGKKQIVIGLLTDDEGIPVAIRVFEGNTADTSTFGDQIVILRDKLKIKNVVMVGDGGMIKSPQRDALPSDYNYITSIGKPQIESLIKEGVIEVDLFDIDLCEVNNDSVRYIFRKNPLRDKDIKRVREEKFKKIKEFTIEQNEYLQDHPKAKVDIALKRVKEKLVKLKINKWIKIESSQRTLAYLEDEEEKTKIARLDGCYCIRTDVDTNINAKTIHARYKDLAKVESAFRTMKTGHLEIRPLYLRKASHTRGHVFIVMLAYMIEKELSKLWKDSEGTVKESLQDLMAMSTLQIKNTSNNDFTKLPKPNNTCKDLFKMAGVKIPSELPY
jgi:transposase